MEFGTKMSHSVVVGAVAHVMQAYRHRARLLVGHEVRLLLVDGPQKDSGSVVPGQFLVDDVHHRRFCPIGHHLDGVDQVLAVDG
jgi:hypothetical protein